MAFLQNTLFGMLIVFIAIMLLYMLKSILDWTLPYLSNYVDPTTAMLLVVGIIFSVIFGIIMTIVER